MFRTDMELAYVHEDSIKEELKKVSCPDVAIISIKRSSEGYTVTMETSFEEVAIFVRKIFRALTTEEKESIQEPLNLVKETAEKMQEHYDDVANWLMDIILKAEEEDDVLGGRILL